MGSIRLILLLFGIFAILSCSPTGWTIGGYELSPSDTLISANFVIITCVDSLEHWYKEIVDESDNWCFLHTEWEYVRKQ